MDPIITAGIINGVGQGAQNLLTAGVNLYEAKKQRDWSEKMYNEQNAWNYEMWQKENEYNTPLNQVQRLRDAGLNPLYYGLDGSSAGDLTAAQPLGYERANIPNMPNPFDSVTNAITQKAQVELLQAQVAKTTEETLTEVQRREKLTAEIDNVKQELENKLAEESLTVSQRANLDKATEWMDRLNEAVVNEKKANAALSESQKKRIDELLENEKIIQSKTIQDFDKKWQKIDAEIKKISQEAGIAYLDIQNYALNHMTGGVMGTGISLQNLARTAINGIDESVDLVAGNSYESSIAAANRIAGNTK